MDRSLNSISDCYLYSFDFYFWNPNLFISTSDIISIFLTFYNFFVANIILASLGDDDTLDLSSYLNTSGFHTVELRPNGNTYLSAGTKLKVFKIE